MAINANVQKATWPSRGHSAKQLYRLKFLWTVIQAHRLLQTDFFIKPVLKPANRTGVTLPVHPQSTGS